VLAVRTHAKIARRFGECFEEHKWAVVRARSPLARRIRPHHECAGDCGGVFRCEACGQFVGWCVGGSEDNLCAKCWCKTPAAKAVE
jgi:hypothetical protein